MQTLGICACCPDGHKRMVNNAINPQTGKLERVCHIHERTWFKLREPSMPREEYEYADRPWRRLY